jgi:hypothetical protein
MLTSQQYALKHGLTGSRIRQLCIAGKIDGAVKFGRDWAIPADALLPPDLRIGAKHRIKKRIPHG